MADSQRTPLEEYFRSRVRRGDGCWTWTGNLNQFGYGIVCVRGVKKRAHRVAWEIEHGPIPHGLFVCHHCDNPCCVRTDHLFLGTPKDNCADMHRKGRGNAGGHKTKTHCPRGHEYNETNTYHHRGHRNCKACRAGKPNPTPASYWHERYQRFKAAGLCGICGRDRQAGYITCAKCRASSRNAKVKKRQQINTGERE